MIVNYIPVSHFFVPKWPCLRERGSPDAIGTHGVWSPVSIRGTSILVFKTKLTGIDFPKNRVKIIETMGMGETTKFRPVTFNTWCILPALIRIELMCLPKLGGVNGWGVC